MSEPVCLDCPTCGGGGCVACEDKGRFELTGCPLEYVSEESWELIGFTELYEKGLPPVAGGALDQCRGFIEACRFVWGEQRFWKAKLGLFN